MKYALKKSTKLFSTALLGFSLISPNILHSNNNSSTSKQMLKQGNLMAEQYNIEESKYFHLNSIDLEDANVITETRLNDYINAVEDKTEYRLYAVDLNETVVHKAIGTLKANIQNKLNACLTETPNDINAAYTSTYQYVTDQAKIFGTDVMDYDYTYYVVLPELLDSISNNTLSSTNAYLASEILDVFKQCLYENFENAIDNLMNITDYMSSINDSIETSNLTSILKTNKVNRNWNDVYTDQVLSTNINYFFNKISTGGAEINPEGLSLFKDYSPDGKGIEYKGQPVPLDSNTIAALFNYSYDLSIGYDKDEIDFDDISPTEPGEYSQDIISYIYLNGALSSLHTDTCIYETNEFLPGYALDVNFLGLDSDTDSHTCSIKLQFGVHETGDSYVFWLPETKDIEIDGEKVDDSQNVDISSYHDLIRNVTNNRYLQEYNFCANIDAKPNKQNIYFDDSADTRTTIDKIMQKYNACTKHDQSYNLSRNPIILDPEDYEGIPVPTNIASNLNEVWHTNQSLALVASDIDTDLDILSINWAIIDKNINSNLSDSDTENDFIIVKNIPWNISGKELDKIDVQFNISKELEKDLKEATDNFFIFNNMNKLTRTGIELCSKSEQDDMDKIYHRTLRYTWTLIGMVATVNLISVGLCIADIYLAGALTDLTALGVGMATVFCLCAAADIAGYAVEQITQKNMLAKSKDLNSTYDTKTGNNFLKDTNNLKKSIQEAYSTIADPYVLYDLKSQAAAKINNSMHSIYNTYKDVMYTTIDKYSSNDVSDEQKAKLKSTITKKPGDYNDDDLVLLNTFAGIATFAVISVNSMIYSCYSNIISHLDYLISESKDIAYRRSYSIMLEICYDSIDFLKYQIRQTAYLLQWPYINLGGMCMEVSGDLFSEFSRTKPRFDVSLPKEFATNYIDFLQNPVSDKFFKAISSNDPIQYPNWKELKNTIIEQTKEKFQSAIESIESTEKSLAEMRLKREEYQENLLNREKRRSIKKIKAYQLVCKILVAGIILISIAQIIVDCIYKYTNLY